MDQSIDSDVSSLEPSAANMAGKWSSSSCRNRCFCAAAVCGDSFEILQIEVIWLIN